MITGFPSPAQGYEDKTFDIGRFLIKHPAATRLINVETNRFNKLGIYNGDILVVDCSKRICKDSLVVYESEGEMLFGFVYSIRTEAVINGAIVHIIHTVRE